MGDGMRLALGILIFLAAFVFFFFAFHPGGVANINNPGDMLKWLVNEFNAPGAAEAQAAGGSTASGGILPTPTGQPPVNTQIIGA